MVGVRESLPVTYYMNSTRFISLHLDTRCVVKQTMNKSRVLAEWIKGRLDKWGLAELYQWGLVEWSFFVIIPCMLILLGYFIG